jgi:protein-tyrosine kinase
MSHLLKALKSLETRGAPFAPPAGLALPAEQQQVEPPAERPLKVKPRLAARVRPRRAEQPTVELIPPRPVMETLQELPQQVATQPSAEAPSPVRKSPAACAALARELAVEEVASGQWSDEEYPAAARHENQRRSPAAPSVRSATLFEHRIRETLMHPARSRPFADLVQRLRQDFRGSSERSLLFTGIGPSSRGDEMLAHVAALFAEQGERVLLVDADFERAGLTAGFGAGTMGGVQNALVSPRTWRDHLLPTSFDKLSFFPTGRGNLSVESAAATLTSFIPELESEHTLVLIDGGQSSGSLLLPLARSCDATYFVIRLGTTDAKEAQSALKSFRAAGARVMGCVAVMANE